MDKRIVPRRHMLMHRIHYVLVCVGARDFKDARVARENTFRSGAQAARDDHAAVFLQGLADGIQGFIDSRVDESAGVDHDDVRGSIACRDFVPFRAQPRQDALRINERFGAAEADESDFRCTVQGRSLCAPVRAALEKGLPCYRERAAGARLSRLAHRPQWRRRPDFRLRAVPNGAQYKEERQGH